ncbi:MAG: membrane protein insertion efficiency factor YidD [Maricaulis sp.]|nr:membrane protein insertion efficiency factor YidD [Maricaulis sp.]MDG2044892.1 membrane protein insertion efficiency factor YidD [Maricaulis sp.]
MIGFFRAYQLSLSPIFYALGVRCRHLPTCSAYAIDAVRAQGGWRGGWLAAGRVCRCRPGGTHGYDPAPHACPEVPWWSVWRFRSPFRSDKINTLPPASHADDKDEDQ